MTPQRIAVHITPTIGRRLWYWPNAYDRTERQETSLVRAYRMRQFSVEQPCDAGVVYVHKDGKVNLSVIDHNGRLHCRHFVRLLQPGETPVAGEAYATWMTCQIAAAKTEKS